MVNDQSMKDAIWIAHSLFQRNKTQGSSANMSFRDGDQIYITGSGTCFGNLSSTDFAVLDLAGNHISGPKPSKEWPLHLMMYQKEGIAAVIHTHGPYAVAWSCLLRDAFEDCIPSYTPYLRMKLGAVKCVEYHKPGSEKLFAAVSDALDMRDGYLLKNHGAVVRGKDLFSAFYALEELEESARLAVLMLDKNVDAIEVEG